MKKIIAYSSVAHMNLVVLGLFSNTFQGLQGAIFMMVGHALSSSGLFFLVGCLYDRYRSRLITYYGNLVQTMPLFSFFMLLYCLTNFSLPGTCNFVGEILILFGIFEVNNLVMFIVVISTLITLLYSILLLNKLIYGTSKTNYINKFIDLYVWEFEILIYLSLLILLCGLKPNIVLDVTYTTSLNLVLHYNLNI